MDWTTYEQNRRATLKERLSVRVDEAMERLQSLKHDIENLRAEDHAAIARKASEIRQRIDGQRTSSEGLREEASRWLHERADEGEDVVQSWRAKRAVRRLERRAEHAEEFAVSALVNAMIEADEAEMAILEAFQARLDADVAAA